MASHRISCNDIKIASLRRSLSSVAGPMTGFWDFLRMLLQSHILEGVQSDEALQHAMQVGLSCDPPQCSHLTGVCRWLAVPGLHAAALAGAYCTLRSSGV